MDIHIFASVVPDHLIGEWELPDCVNTQIDELNELATNVYNKHLDFIFMLRMRCKVNKRLQHTAAECDVNHL